MDKEKKILIKEITDQIEILSIIAIPREKEAYKTYVSLANKSSFPAAKEMFVALAKQEVSHEQQLIALRKELQEKLIVLKKSL